MPNLGVWEIGLIFLIVLVIFGPKSLPRVGQALGRGIKEFKDAARGLTADLEEDDREKRRVELAQKPTETVAPPTVIESPAQKS